MESSYCLRGLSLPSIAKYTPPSRFLTQPPFLQPPSFSPLRAHCAPARSVPSSLSCCSPLPSSLRSPFLCTIPRPSGLVAARSSIVEATVVPARDSSPAWMAATRCSPFLRRFYCSQRVTCSYFQGKKRSGALELLRSKIVSAWHIHVVPLFFSAWEVLGELDYEECNWTTLAKDMERGFGVARFWWFLLGSLYLVVCVQVFDRDMFLITKYCT